MWVVTVVWVSASLCSQKCPFGKGISSPSRFISCPEHSRRLRFPDCEIIGTWRCSGQPSAPATFTPQEIFLVFISVRVLSRPQSHSVTRRIMLMKYSYDTTGNWTLDIPAYGVLPQSASTNCVTKELVPAGILIGCWLEWESVHSEKAIKLCLVLYYPGTEQWYLMRNRQVLPGRACTVLHCICVQK